MDNLTHGNKKPKKKDNDYWVKAYRSFLCGNLHPYQKLLLLYLGVRGPGCFPSLDKIATDLNFSRSTVKRHIKTLKHRGLLKFYKDGQTVKYYAPKILKIHGDGLLTTSDAILAPGSQRT